MFGATTVSSAEFPVILLRQSQVHSEQLRGARDLRMRKDDYIMIADTYYNS